MAHQLTIKQFSGQEIAPYLKDIAGLRIKVFREFPYLYEGNLAYEENYLSVYVNCPRSQVFLVFDQDKIVGVTTTIPMIDENTGWQKPFLGKDIPIQNILYYGESILLPEYRGQKIGYEFFALREQRARDLGLSVAAFCAVDRPINHPLRPANYKPFDEFWRKLGFEKRDDIVAHFPWKDIDKETETDKSLIFWIKNL